jgi:hypothetical protein
MNLAVPSQPPDVVLGSSRHFHTGWKEVNMLTLLLGVGIIMCALWALGLITRRTFGGFLHIALIVAVILVVLWVILAIL